MFTMFLERPAICVDSVDLVYNQLQWCDVKNIITEDLLHLCDTRLVGTVEQIAEQAYMFQIGITTKYGDAVLSDVPTGLKILVLALLAKKKKQKFCFDVSLLGANYIPYLLEIASDTNLIAGYARKGRFVMCDKDYSKLYHIMQREGV